MATTIAMSGCEPTPREDEAALVARARHDPAALAALYRANYAAIHGYVHRRVGCQADADELVAEAFLAMVRYLPRYRQRGAPFRAWLYRLATTQIGRWARCRRRWATARLEELAAVERRDEAEVSEDAERVRTALLVLPERYQAALALHYLEELPVAEVALVLGCRVGTVKSRLSRGREALRRLLEPQETKNA